MPSDRKDRKGRFLILCCKFDRVCLDAFPIVSRIEFWNLVVFCAPWSVAGEGMIRSASCRARGF